jgi:DNA-binding transcriptional ArsR family regulator
LGATFAALADPVRRQVVKMLQERPRRAGEIAAAFDVSGPAISKHLRVLRRSRLIAESADANDARIRIYSLQPQAFDELDDWMQGIRTFWTAQLESFKALAEAQSGATQSPSNLRVARPRSGKTIKPRRR